MKKLFFAALSVLALFVSCTEDFAGSTPEGNETPAVDKPAANEIWYTAAEKITPYNSDAFGATILSNEWDSETGEGIITFDGAVTSIGNEAFKNCSSLTSINIPKGVNSIKYHAFAGCSSLASINIPEGVTSIRDNAFDGCSSLTSINIPEGVTSIGVCAFFRCSSLTSINIPESATSIGIYAFCDCSSLTSINIPKGVISIESFTFNGCSSLTNITIPESVTSIKWNAFNGCTSLESIHCEPTTPPTLGSKALAETSALSAIYVPMESVEAYKAAEGWRDYASAIVGYDF